MPQNLQVNSRKNNLVQYLKRLANAYFYRNQLNNSAVLDIPYFRRLIDSSSPLIEVLTPNYLDNWIDQKTRSIIKTHVGSYYRESNLRTSSLIDINLGNYGYNI